MTVTLLGDPHLGRQFIHNVPLHRRGEREQSVWRDFEASILGCQTKTHINMGDIFDKPYMSYDTILRAFQTYRDAPKATNFYVLRGNHDLNRDLEKASAFTVFESLCRSLDNVWVLDAPFEMNGMVFFPWEPIRSATEIVESAGDLTGFTAYGHWDTDGAVPNLIPTKALFKAGVRKAYTGHVHLPTEFTRDGVDVTVVGSMQPYAHGEGSLYVTRTLAEVEEDLDAYKDLCLRVVLEPGEVFDHSIDCLQLTVTRLDGEAEEVSVEVGDFNITDIFTEAFSEAGVHDSMRDLILDRYTAGRMIG